MLKDQVIVTTVLSASEQEETPRDVGTAVGGWDVLVVSDRRRWRWLGARRIESAPNGRSPHAEHVGNVSDGHPVRSQLPGCLDPVPRNDGGTTAYSPSCPGRFEPSSG